MTLPVRDALAPPAPPPYFASFETRLPPAFPGMSLLRSRVWHVLAGATIGLGLWYLQWRWTQSLNPDAMVFSVVVALVETVAFLGTLLFFYDIWSEGDTPLQPAPATRAEAGLDDGDAHDDAPIRVDVFITTYNEDENILLPSIAAAQALQVPVGVELRIHLLDDGSRPAIAEVARANRIGYITRCGNRGFKAGNLSNALLHTSGDFVVICDADTRLLPTLLTHTLGYFRDAKVAWVQTPHWFYDIPDGTDWKTWLARRLGQRSGFLSYPLKWISGRDRTGADPFMTDPALFFDVIQRRRNRHGASFCCGAASIHRREPLYDAALRRQSQDLAKLSRTLRLTGPAPAGLLNASKLQPFRFHVSEDIYTSIILHSDAEGAWTSVYHPQPESRMLSPWSMEAWATQKLKYAGGTFDIMLRDNPVFKRGMPWRTRLHYAATFWSYLSVLWIPVMLLAPVISLFTGVSPLHAPTATFFLHLLPLLLVDEAALVVGCNGHDPNPGRVMSIASLAVQWRALWQVLRGRPPSFPVTPKTPGAKADLRHVRSNLAALGIMALAAIWGLVAMALGSSDHQPGLVIVNLFWLAWNSLALWRLVISALWVPPVSTPEVTPMARIVPARRARPVLQQPVRQSQSTSASPFGVHADDTFASTP